MSSSNLVITDYIMPCLVPPQIQLDYAFVLTFESFKGGLAVSVAAVLQCAAPVQLAWAVHCAGPQATQDPHTVGHRPLGSERKERTMAYLGPTLYPGEKCGCHKMMCFRAMYIHAYTYTHMYTGVYIYIYTHAYLKEYASSGTSPQTCLSGIMGSVHAAMS